MTRRGGQIVPLLALAATLFGWSAAPALGQPIVYTGSVQVASGDYIFAERTTSLYIINGLEVAAGPVRLSGMLPVISQSTPWVTYGPIPVPSGGSRSADVGAQMGQMGRAGRGGGRMMVVLPTDGIAQQTGLGDPLVRGDVELLRDSASRPSIRVNLGAKIPVADPDDGFGSGEWDYGAGVALAKRVGSNAVFADVAYWRFGDLPELELKDAMAYSAAYGRMVGAGRWSLLASVSGWTRILDGADPPVEIGFGISRLMHSAARSVSVIGSVGLTETAPDVSIAVGWRVGL